ncbi:hypothetical protein HPB52_004725 [Rhipicephalus sanguineus]|uniref:Uncharacterized protein n=1 Tax=Rhipicephalus sanguineus TaxID=34632 RepID=A0A9D4PRN7_RHISA|nr:hypothetical protein HPB52_004725 [Rhipicephalus sanguineus]
MEPLIGYRRDPDGTVVASGLGGYVYNLVVNSLKIKHVVLIPRDHVYAGTFPNGSWAGCLGMISRNADLAIGPILPTITRFMVAQPLPQYYFIRLTTCAGTRRLFKTDVFGYVTALDTQARAFLDSVWATLLASMLLLAILMSVPSAGGRSRMSMFADQLMDLVGNMFFEATPEPPEDSYRRWLTSFWWIVVMVVMTGFTGIMKASMMVKDQAGRINGIHDVIERPEIKPYLIDGSTYHRLFSRLWRQVQRYRSVTSATEILSKQTFDEVLDEKAIFFCDDIMLYWTVARLYPNGVDGEFYLGTDFFINNEFTMFIRREFDKGVIKKMHLRLRWLWDAGLPQEWNRRTMEAALRHTTDTQTTVVAAMKLTDVGAIFYLMLFGQAFACTAGLFEVFFGMLLPAATRALAQRRSASDSPHAVRTGRRLSAVEAPTRLKDDVTSTDYRRQGNWLLMKNKNKEVSRPPKVRPPNTVQATDTIRQGMAQATNASAKSSGNDRAKTAIGQQLGNSAREQKMSGYPQDANHSQPGNIRQDLTRPQSPTTPQTPVQPLPSFQPEVNRLPQAPQYQRAPTYRVPPNSTQAAGYAQDPGYPRLAQYLQAPKYPETYAYPQSASNPEPSGYQQLYPQAQNDPAAFVYQAPPAYAPSSGQTYLQGLPPDMDPYKQVYYDAARNGILPQAPWNAGFYYTEQPSNTGAPWQAEPPHWMQDNQEPRRDMRSVSVMTSFGPTDSDRSAGVTHHGTAFSCKVTPSHHVSSSTVERSTGGASLQFLDFTWGAPERAPARGSYKARVMPGTVAKDVGLETKPFSWSSRGPLKHRDPTITQQFKPATEARREGALYSGSSSAHEESSRATEPKLTGPVVLNTNLLRSATSDNDDAHQDIGSPGSLPEELDTTSPPVAKASGKKYSKKSEDAENSDSEASAGQVDEGRNPETGVSDAVCPRDELSSSEFMSAKDKHAPSRSKPKAAASIVSPPSRTELTSEQEEEADKAGEQMDKELRDLELTTVELYPESRLAQQFSTDTLLQASMETQLLAFIKDRAHADVTPARKLYNMCMNRGAANAALLDAKKLLRQWGSDWPQKDSANISPTDVWHFAAKLMQVLGVPSLVGIEIGLDPWNIDLNIIELGPPRTVFFSKDVSEPRVMKLFSDATRTAAKALDPNDASAANAAAKDVSIALASISLLQLDDLGTSPLDFQVIKFTSLGKGVQYFLRTVFANIVTLDTSTRLLVHRSPLVRRELDETVNSLPPRAMLNYLGLLALVALSPFLPEQLSSLRVLHSVHTLGRAEIGSNDVLCLRAVSQAYPACLATASQALYKNTHRSVWLSQLESLFVGYVRNVVWMDNLTSLFVRYKMQHHRLARFFPVWPLGDCNSTTRAASSKAINAFVDAVRLRQTQELEQVPCKASAASEHRLTVVGVARYRLCLQLFQIPAGLVNGSVPANSSVFALHLSRLAVRLYAALAQLLYEGTVYEREIPLYFTEEAERTLEDLLDCLVCDARRRFPHGLRAERVRYALLEQVLALQLGFLAFRRLLSVRRIWSFDFRFSTLPEVSSDQLFFLYYALDHCELSDAVFESHQFEAYRRLPAAVRVNMAVRQSTQFAQAFRCPSTSPMAAGELCQVLR